MLDVAYEIQDKVDHVSVSCGGSAQLYPLINSVSQSLAYTSTNEVINQVD